MIRSNHLWNDVAVFSVHADVAELADAPDLGSGGRSPCRFKSCHPHHNYQVEKDAIVSFLT